MKEAIECAVILLADAVASMKDREEDNTESFLEVKDALDILERVDTSKLTKPTFTVYFPSGYRTDPHDIEAYMHRNPTAWHRFAATDRYWAPALEVIL